MFILSFILRVRRQLKVEREREWKEKGGKVICFNIILKVFVVTV